MTENPDCEAGPLGHTTQAPKDFEAGRGEFQFTSNDNNQVFPGWFIDDVEVKLK